jgi:hypothetical protein
MALLVVLAFALGMNVERLAPMGPHASTWLSQAGTWFDLASSWLGQQASGLQLLWRYFF